MLGRRLFLIAFGGIVGVPAVAKSLAVLDDEQSATKTAGRFPGAAGADGSNTVGGPCAAHRGMGHAPRFRRIGLQPRVDKY
jgi:hypothetical protein